MLQIKYVQERDAGLYECQVRESAPFMIVFGLMNLGFLIFASSAAMNTPFLTYLSTYISEIWLTP